MTRKQSKRQKVLSYEEAAKHLLESSLKECQRQYLNIPSYIFKVGDRVHYGRWDFAKILEVYEGGRYYKVYQETDDIQYGKNLGKKSGISYHPWVDLNVYRSPEEIKNIDRMTENDDVVLHYSQRDVSSLIYLYYSFGIDLNPDYQRGNIWSQEQKVSLIDSIFKNIDIGKITIIKRNFEVGNKSYEILDGKQRLIALIEFSENRFEYKGKKYEDLHPRDQYHFSGYPFSYSESKPLTKQQKYKYFLKLNTAGSPVDPKHIEMVSKKLELLNQRDLKQ